MGRKVAREGAMGLIYTMEMNNDFSKSIEDLFLENFEFEKDEEFYIREASDKIMDKLETIDEAIMENLKGWKLDRLAKVDLSILRIAVYEIIYRDDIPKEVSVNEAIEIAKKYSNDDAYKFINGVLGGVISKLERE